MDKIRIEAREGEGGGDLALFFHLGFMNQSYQYVFGSGLGTTEPEIPVCPANLVWGDVL